MTLSRNTHLNALQSDALSAIRSTDTGPADIFQHSAIVDALSGAEGAFPPVYERKMRIPLHQTFTARGPLGWSRVLDSDPMLERGARLGMDLTQSIVQRADPDVSKATLAFQEVVSDLYDGYLSEADRTGVKPPDHSVIAPLVKWGQPHAGPYVWPAPAAAGYGCGTGVVSMPPAFASAGLAAWSALGHEGAGHAILHADIGLHDELAANVAQKIRASRDASLSNRDARDALADYWFRKIDETASDVMGVLNMGPAAAVGLIAYFRALRRDGKLMPFDTGSPHPTDIARGYLVAAAIGFCDFADAGEWRRLLNEEVTLDAPDEGVWLGGTLYPPEVVQASASLAARSIMNDTLQALEDHRITEIQDWTEEDNTIVQVLMTQVFLSGQPLSQALHDGVYAAHGVAAAILVSLLDGRTGHHQARMIELLDGMHRTNVAWTGLEFAHAGAMLPAHACHFSAWAGADDGYAATAQRAEEMGGMAMDRMAAIGLTFGEDAGEKSSAPPPGSSISIPLRFAGGTAASRAFGSGITIPFGFGARRLGLSTRNGAWQMAPDAAEIPLHEGLTPEMLTLILGQPG